MRLARKAAIAGVLLVSLAGCTTMDGGSKQTAGGLLGAVGGGLAGAQIGSGSGQLVATGIGTLLGALAGNEVGTSLDRADRLYESRFSSGRTRVTPGGYWPQHSSGYGYQQYQDRGYRYYDRSQLGLAPPGWAGDETAAVPPNCRVLDSAGGPAGVPAMACHSPGGWYVVQ